MATEKIKWITDDLPEPQSIEEECNDYYLVQVEYYRPVMAMYLIDEDGNVGWYINYYAKIIKNVTGWCNVS
jgi:hypothetical protein